MRVEITTPPTNDLVSLALSPDGQKLVFVASSDHRPKLWLRSLITGSTEALSNSDEATFPFWSPDSRSIGFFANGNLYRFDVDGGSPRALAVAPVGAGGTWNRNGDILFTLVPDAPLSRVSAGVNGRVDG
jgi:Tol biopolymer transport system component